MMDFTYIVFLAVVIWLAIEFGDGGGGSRRRLRVPAS
jgi:hypothetical protein